MLNVATAVNNVYVCRTLWKKAFACIVEVREEAVSWVGSRRKAFCLKRFLLIWLSNVVKERETERKKKNPLISEGLTPRPSDVLHHCLQGLKCHVIRQKAG